ncbi:MAG: methylated-DNA--[protein]-cysteine S-methyltransferase, partial [Actinomycetota bacterium]
MASATGLRRVDFVNAKRRDLVRPDNEHLIAATRQLGEYFAGRRREFDLVLEPRGTAFQLAAWNVLRTIPYATTIT